MRYDRRGKPDPVGTYNKVGADIGPQTMKASREQRELMEMLTPKRDRAAERRAREAESQVRKAQNEATYQRGLRQSAEADARENRRIADQRLRRVKEEARQKVAAANKRAKRAKEAPKRVVPTSFPKLLEVIAKDPELNVGMGLLAEREAEFPSPLSMQLAAIAVHPPAKAFFDETMDRIWGKRTSLPRDAAGRDVVVGAGFHAAVYCAVRVAKGFPKPLVIEASSKVGGAFGVTRNPSFYLNSRNRPGGAVAEPGAEGALNVLPGSPIQPSMLSGDEYQRNSDIAFAVRATLAMFADVVVETPMRFTTQILSPQTVYTQSGDRGIRAGRMVWATGLGNMKVPGNISVLSAEARKRVFMFNEFMARLDDPFPLRGLGRVAVVGGGDSGKTAVEAMVGQGPSTGLSTSELDWVQQIDWYDDEIPQTRGQFEECNRSRYRPIARHLPRGASRDNAINARVRPILERADSLAGSFEQVLVNGRRYDHVIWCGGMEAAGSLGFSARDYGNKIVDGRVVARETGRNVMIVGPAASLDIDVYEQRRLPGDLPENVVALFRYADRTAALAGSLQAANGSRY